MLYRSSALARSKSLLQKLRRNVLLRREGIFSPELWDEIDRTMSDFLAYEGVQQWWETRRHWHTEAFARVVDDMIARGGKPSAYSTYDLKQVVLTKDRQ